ncbi:MAG: hypothetical protein QOG05_1312 [Streptosporangiaceae bacterium]|nr:hypothetical protein [Streptosporangiaceae bacterium]
MGILGNPGSGLSERINGPHFCQPCYGLKWVRGRHCLILR